MTVRALYQASGGPHLGRCLLRFTGFSAEKKVENDAQKSANENRKTPEGSVVWTVVLSVVPDPDTHEKPHHQNQSHDRFRRMSYLTNNK